MSSDKRRPPSLHRGQPSEREPISGPTITFIMSDKRHLWIAPPAQTARDLFNELTLSINDGRVITLNDPSGTVTMLNPAHIVTMELR